MIFLYFLALGSFDDTAWTVPSFDQQICKFQNAFLLTPQPILVCQHVYRYLLSIFDQTWIEFSISFPRPSECTVMSFLSKLWVFTVMSDGKRWILCQLAPSVGAYYSHIISQAIGKALNSSYHMSADDMQLFLTLDPTRPGDAQSALCFNFLGVPKNFVQSLIVSEFFTNPDKTDFFVASFQVSSTSHFKSLWRCNIFFSLREKRRCCFWPRHNKHFRSPTQLCHSV